MYVLFGIKELRKIIKALKNNIIKDSVINLPLGFLLKENLFLNKYLLELLFKFGIFKSAIYKNSN